MNPPTATQNRLKSVAASPRNRFQPVWCISSGFQSAAVRHAINLLTCNNPLGCKRCGLRRSVERLIMDAKTDPPAPRMGRMEHWLIRCENCGTIDHTHRISDLGGYGRIVGRTCFGELTEFSAWEDPAYDELLGIVSTFAIEGVPKLRKCFQKVMSLVADPAPSGERYTFIGRLCCRQCGSSAHWYKPGEPDVEEIPLPLVTHHQWERLNPEEKSKLIEAALRSYGCI